jgi:hypothetical protein
MYGLADAGSVGVVASSSSSSSSAPSSAAGNNDEVDKELAVVTSPTTLGMTDAVSSSAGNVASSSSLSDATQAPRTPRSAARRDQTPTTTPHSTGQNKRVAGAGAGEDNDAGCGMLSSGPIYPSPRSAARRDQTPRTTPHSTGQNKRVAGAAGAGEDNDAGCGGMFDSPWRDDVADASYVSKTLFSGTEFSEDVVDNGSLFEAVSWTIDADPMHNAPRTKGHSYVTMSPAGAIVDGAGATAAMAAGADDSVDSEVVAPSNATAAIVESDNDDALGTSDDDDDSVDPEVLAPIRLPPPNATMNEQVCKRPSPNNPSGYAIYATQNLLATDYLCVITGHKTSKSKAASLHPSKVLDCTGTTNNCFVVMDYDGNDPGVFVTVSSGGKSQQKKINARLDMQSMLNLGGGRFQFFIVATKNICAGQQICINGGRVYRKKKKLFNSKQKEEGAEISWKKGVWKETFMEQFIAPTSDEIAFAEKHHVPIPITDDRRDALMLYFRQENVQSPPACLKLYQDEFFNHFMSRNRVDVDGVLTDVLFYRLCFADLDPEIIAGIRLYFEGLTVPVMDRTEQDNALRGCYQFNNKMFIRAPQGIEAPPTSLLKSFDQKKHKNREPVTLKFHNTRPEMMITNFLALKLLLLLFDPVAVSVDFFGTASNFPHKNRPPPPYKFDTHAWHALDDYSTDLYMAAVELWINGQATGPLKNVPVKPCDMLDQLGGWNISVQMQDAKEVVFYRMFLDICLPDHIKQSGIMSTFSYRQPLPSEGGYTAKVKALGINKADFCHIRAIQQVVNAILAAPSELDVRKATAILEQRVNDAAAGVVTTVNNDKSVARATSILETANNTPGLIATAKKQFLKMPGTDTPANIQMNDLNWVGFGHFEEGREMLPRWEKLGQAVGHQYVEGCTTIWLSDLNSASVEYTLDLFAHELQRFRKYVTIYRADMAHPDSRRYYKKNMCVYSIAVLGHTMYSYLIQMLIQAGASTLLTFARNVDSRDLGVVRYDAGSLSLCSTTASDTHPLVYCWIKDMDKDRIDKYALHSSAYYVTWMLQNFLNKELELKPCDALCNVTDFSAQLKKGCAISKEDLFRLVAKFIVLAWHNGDYVIVNSRLTTLLQEIDAKNKSKVFLVLGALALQFMEEVPVEVNAREAAKAAKQDAAKAAKQDAAKATVPTRATVHASRVSQSKATTNDYAASRSLSVTNCYELNNVMEWSCVNVVCFFVHPGNVADLNTLKTFLAQMPPTCTLTTISDNEAPLDAKKGVIHGMTHIRKVITSSGDATTDERKMAQTLLERYNKDRNVKLLLFFCHRNFPSEYQQKIRGLITTVTEILKEFPNAVAVIPYYRHIKECYTALLPYNVRKMDRLATLYHNPFFLSMLVSEFMPSTGSTLEATEVTRYVLGMRELVDSGTHLVVTAANADEAENLNLHLV